METSTTAFATQPLRPRDDERRLPRWRETCWPMRRAATGGGRARPVRSASTSAAPLQRAVTWRSTAARWRPIRRYRAHLGRQLGLERLDANWLADEDGISPITGRAGAGPTATYIPTPTNRAIQWHLDGYYHPANMHPAWCCTFACGRASAAQIACSTTNSPGSRCAIWTWLVQALAAPGCDEHPGAHRRRTAWRGRSRGGRFQPSTPRAGCIRYTARTRNIAWKDRSPRRRPRWPRCARRAGATCLRAARPARRRHGPGGNNVLHDREGLHRRSRPRCGCPIAPASLDRIASELGRGWRTAEPSRRAAHLVGVSRGDAAATRAQRRAAAHQRRAGVHRALLRLYPQRSSWSGGAPAKAGRGDQRNEDLRAARA